MKRKILGAGVCLVVVGFVVVEATFARPLSAKSGHAALPAAVNTAYSVNRHGQTYGSAMGVSTPAQLPDLIQVQATNGATGYVTREDLLGPSPTLNQVLGYPRDSQGNFVAPQPASTIPVYASNGTTQVGVFPVGGDTASGSLGSDSSTAGGGGTLQP